MLNVIAQYLNAKLATLRYIDKKYGLAAVVQRGENTFPAVMEKDEPVHINYDGYRSLVYFMLNGKVERTTEEHPHLACKYLVKETFPLKLIVYVLGKENVNCDSKSQDILWGIGQILTGRQKTLASEAGYEYAEIQIKNSELNKKNVWSELTNGPVKLKDNDILLSIELDVLTEGVESCFVAAPCENRTFEFSLSHTELCERVDTCLASNNETLTVDIVAGSNTFAHTLGAVPDMISFWKDNYLWLINFDTQLTASSVIINSTDNFDDITIKLLKF